MTNNLEQDSELKTEIRQLLEHEAMTYESEDGEYLAINVDFAVPIVVALIEQREEQHIENYKWLLGYNDFPECKEGEGSYYWRKELRKRIPDSILATLKEQL